MDSQIKGVMVNASAHLARTAFITNRTQEFFSEPGFTRQIGYGKALWPVVLVKELVDNALDGCEMTDVRPEIAVTLDQDAITIRDNGPGLKAEIVTRSLDFRIGISDKKYYIAPTRGQLGNALKCVWAAPFVASGKSLIEISAAGVDHRIEVDLDRLAQKPRIEHLQNKNRLVKNGTLVKVHWPKVASLNTQEGSAEFYQSTVSRALSELVTDFAALNPHAGFSLEAEGKTSRFPASDSNYRKWRTCDPSSPHWYRLEDLRELVAAYIRNGNQMRLRDFIAEFDGLSGTQYRRRVLEQAKLADCGLADLVSDGDIDMGKLGRLLTAMQRNSRPVKPGRLGTLGKDHLAMMLGAYGVNPDGFRYRKKTGVDETDNLPYVVEVGFGVLTSQHARRKLIIGMNNSPVFKVPSEYLADALSECHLQTFDPVVLLIHLATPRFVFTDQGKGSIV